MCVSRLVFVQRLFVYCFESLSLTLYTCHHLLSVTVAGLTWTPSVKLDMIKGDNSVSIVYKYGTESYAP